MVWLFWVGCGVWSFEVVDIVGLVWGYWGGGGGLVGSCELGVCGDLNLE